MLDQKVLETLKKHLKDIDGAEFNIKEARQSKVKTLKFGEDIKSANEFIGALQTLDIALKKIILEAKKADVQSNIQLDCITFNIQGLIENCNFMGVGLFDATMSTALGDTEVQLEVISPMSFVLQNDFDSVIQYLEDKREEIKQKLAFISQKISGDLSAQDTCANEYNLSSSFDPKDFLKMF